MNEELKNRFDGLSSTSENEQLAWEKMGPSIQQALRQEKKRRRFVFWWWFAGFAGILLLGALIFQNQLIGEGGSTEGKTDFVHEVAPQQGVQHLPQSAENAGDEKLLETLGKGLPQVPADTQMLQYNSGSAFAKTTNRRLEASSVEQIKSQQQLELSTEKLHVDSKHQTSEQIGGIAVPNSKPTQQALTVAKQANRTAVETTVLPPGKTVAPNQVVSVNGSMPQNQVFDSGLVLPKGEEHGDRKFGKGQCIDLEALLPIAQGFVRSQPIQLPLLKSSAAILEGIGEVRVAEKNSPAAVLYMQVYGGGLLGNAAAAYKQQENHLGIGAGVALTCELSNGWFAGLGVKSDQLKFTTRATLIDTVREYRPGQVVRVYTFSDIDNVVEYTDSIDVEYIRNVLHHNTQTDVNLPLYVGYRWQVGKWRLSIQAGMQATIFSQLQGKVLSEAGDILVVDQRASQVVFAPHFGAETSYRLRKNWDVSFSGIRQQARGVSSQAIVQPGRFWLSQINVGLRHRISK